MFKKNADLAEVGSPKFTWSRGMYYLNGSQVTKKMREMEKRMAFVFLCFARRLGWDTRFFYKGNLLESKFKFIKAEMNMCVLCKHFVMSHIIEYVHNLLKR